jgi:hypothetical protein
MLAAFGYTGLTRRIFYKHVTKPSRQQPVEIRLHCIERWSREEETCKQNG